jgi:hypothetical protein
LKKTPKDPDGAWDRALRATKESGAFSALGWSLFPDRFFMGPVKELVLRRHHTMTRVFPAWRIEESVREKDTATGGITDWKARGRGWLEIDQDATDYIERTLGERFGVDVFFLMNLTARPETWAAVLFTEIIKDADEVLKARAELRDQIRFATYGDAKPGMLNPPLGAMTTNGAEALKLASTRHAVFKKTWDALQACAPDKNCYLPVQMIEWRRLSWCGPAPFSAENQAPSGKN